MLGFLTSLPQQRKPWLLLAFSAFALELSALFFQYGLKLDPCVMCVYERTAMMGLIAAGLIGALMPGWIVTRLIAFALWLASGFWGLQLAIEHTGYQQNDSPFGATCSFFAEYPGWFKLDKWAPWMFEPNGFCDQIDWMFLGWSMPQWLILIFAVYAALGCLFFVLQWFNKKA